MNLRSYYAIFDQSVLITLALGSLGALATSRLVTYRWHWYPARVANFITVALLPFMLFIHILVPYSNRPVWCQELMLAIAYAFGIAFSVDALRAPRVWIRMSGALFLGLHALALLEIIARRPEVLTTVWD